ncbi:hypothetical protein GCK32_010169 [Trichostrongylus colubriformis]|uniref:Uncharacterized protein n=1 Tax=Trichostrongylus colubriformis TaxID=6319 RepID=A0AAN8FS61_TRICO
MQFRLDSSITSLQSFALFVLISLLSVIINVVNAELELDATIGLQVECIQCVQLWASASQRETKACGPHAKTCKGSACFMRQCKHCPIYQYMSGCVNLTPWQIADIEVNRRRSELRLRRVGAILLCEDTFNQTTCICNRWGIGVQLTQMTHKCSEAFTEMLQDEVMRFNNKAAMISEVPRSDHQLPLPVRGKLKC